MVCINKKMFEEMTKSARESYPYEGCGLLLGKNGSVGEVHFVKNIYTERLVDRYEIDPADFMRVDKIAREKSLDIVGFYHSHPDHPSSPSAFDTDRAWPEYIYIIVSVQNGRDCETKAWILDQNEKIFKEAKLEIKEN